MSTPKLIFLFVTSALGTLLALRVSYSLALRFRLMTARKLGRNRPGATRHVPLIGGFGALGGIAVGLLLSMPVSGGDALLRPEEINAQLLAILGACAILWAGGMIVDWLKKPATLVLLSSQIAAIALLLAAGVRIRAMNFPGGWEVPAWLASVLTALWLFVMIQFSRFLDGIDGLLPAVAIALTFAQLRMVWGMPEPFALSLGTVCLAVYFVLLGASIYPARIYLGENGAAIPGLLLGMMAIAARTKSFMTISALVPLIIFLLTAGFIGLRLLERSLLAVRLPRANPESAGLGANPKSRGTPVQSSRSANKLNKIARQPRTH